MSQPAATKALIDLITNAVIAGAACAKMESTAPTVTSRHEAVTALLGERYPSVDLARIAQQPGSARGRDYLIEDLEGVNACNDDDLLAAALALLGALDAEEDARQEASAIGVDVHNVLAAGLDIFDVASEDLAVRVRNSRFLGNMQIGQVVAGDGESNAPGMTGNIELRDNQAQEIQVGDRIAGDKLGGDKIYGDKIVYQNAPALDLTKVEQAYLEGLYADCNALLLANDGPVDQAQKRQPRMQRVYVELETNTKASEQVVRQRLAVHNIELDALWREVRALDGDAAEMGHPNRLEDTAHNQVTADRSTATYEMLSRLDSESLEQVAAALQTEADVLRNVFVNMSALEAIHLHRQLVILGDPGGGKSTLTRRLAGVLASGCRKEPDESQEEWLRELDAVFGRRLLPVRVEMSHWAANLATDASGHAADLVAECVRIQQQTARLSDGTQEPHFVQRLTGDEPTVLILLDGLDEVSNQALRATLLAVVQDFCTSYPQVPLIVTCRIRPYAAWQKAGEALPLPAFTLAPLSRAAAGDFIERWHAELVWAGRYQSDASQTAKTRLLTAIDDSNRTELRQMAGTPLLLTMMARVNYARGLPNSRAALYEEYVEQLLWEWERTKLDEKGQPTSLEALLNQANVPRGSLEKALNQLAYAVHDPVAHEDTVDISKSQVRDALEFIHPGSDEEKAAWAVKVLHVIDDRTGLLYSKDDQHYHFSHRTFQEYLAARQMTAGKFVAKFEERLDLEQWREAIFLGLGYQIAVRAAYDDALAIFDELMPTAPETAVEWRRVLLLGDAYARLFGRQLARQTEQKRRSDRVVESVPRLLTSAMQNRDLSAPERLAAGKSLAALGEVPPDLEKFVGIPGQLFSIGKYPITNRQFARFMQDGGYQDDRWWMDEEGRQYRDEGQWSEPRFWHNEQFKWPNQSVVGVSWYESVAYCAWLTHKLRQKQEIGANEEVRLPTEAEWMAAAHADEGTYPWGDKFEPFRANTEESNLRQTTPVHMYADGQTADDVWDLSGNVYEWSSDWLDDKYPIWKGGSWLYAQNDAKSAARDGLPPVGGSSDVGFRCVVVPISH